jgi:NAD(P)-dependent dehydrogenase (short-subunit alcohol dehydrogenase family)
MQDITGKVALITGAGSGLGEATARAFAQAGCAVACLDLRREPFERVAAALAQRDTPSAAYACDVSDAERVFEVVADVAERFGRLDVVVNCAAVDHTV